MLNSSPNLLEMNMGLPNEILTVIMEYVMDDVTTINNFKCVNKHIYNIYDTIQKYRFYEEFPSKHELGWNEIYKIGCALRDMFIQNITTIETSYDEKTSYSMIKLNYPLKVKRSSFGYYDIIPEYWIGEEYIDKNMNTHIIRDLYDGASYVKVNTKLERGIDMDDVILNKKAQPIDHESATNFLKKLRENGYVEINQNVTSLAPYQFVALQTLGLVKHI